MPDDDKRTSLQELREKSQRGRRHEPEDSDGGSDPDGRSSPSSTETNVAEGADDRSSSRVEPSSRSRPSSKPSTPGNVDEELVSAVVAGFEALDDSRTQPNLSFRDERVAALMAGLEDNPEKMREIGVTLQEHLGDDVDPDTIDRSEILRLSFRAAVYSAAPELVDVVREAMSQHAASQF